jgi:hypothetical protein
MKKNATFFFEQIHGHNTEWLNKNEILKIMESYADVHSRPVLPFNPGTVLVMILLLCAGMFFGAAAYSSF